MQGTPYSAMLPSSIGHTAHTFHAATAVVHNSVPTMNYVSQKKLCQGSFFQLFSLSQKYYSTSLNQPKPAGLLSRRLSMECCAECLYCPHTQSILLAVLGADAYHIPRTFILNSISFSLIIYLHRFSILNFKLILLYHFLVIFLFKI